MLPCLRAHQQYSWQRLRRPEDPRCEEFAWEWGLCQSRKKVGRDDRNIVWNEAAVAIELKEAGNWRACDEDWREAGASDNVSISESFCCNQG